ncbi:hypothetical protein [Croceicoccus sp. BE223]|uniref:hypothetical protein n=1 Tax=Croceicoccus sp. BE223 TaxID=2817716 RepID=UPI0028623CA4|nr:hypothetical protein [Croceicoccus sp. BE223]MDR7102719.1 uncharacterized membrane protein YhaH (DUF805 family) [Croceicoccus sp. BE223]
MRHLPAIYLVLAIISLGILVAGLPAVAGDDADPLAVVFAFILALPLILVLEFLGDVPMAVTVAVILIAMAVNYAALRLLTRRWRTAPTGDLAAPHDS